MENKATGYIKVFRSLKTHWLWRDATKLKWWLDILLSANYSDQKILLKGTLVECGRGQCIKSLETWAKDWRTTKKTVQTFLRLLQKDEMIFVENVKVTTRITICNYDSYNNSVNEGYTAVDTEPTTHGKRNLPPNNKGNKDNKGNKEEEYTVELFETFWSIYGKKIDRDKCIKKFLSLKKEEHEKIMLTVQSYVLFHSDKQYRKNPLTYLRGKCWDDEIIGFMPTAEPFVLQDKDNY